MRFITLFSILIFALSSLNCFAASSEKVNIVFAAKMNTLDNEKQGSYAELASMLDIYRNQDTPLFFIFGGDSLFPSALSSFDHGTHIIDILNSLEPDVMAANRGDFAHTESELSLRTYEAAFPVVQSNMVEISNGKSLDGVLASVIIEQGAYKLGFISIMDQVDREAYNLKQTDIIQPKLAIEEESKALYAQGVDLVILHYGGSELNCNDFLNSGTVDLVLRNRLYSRKLTDEMFNKHPRQIVLPDTALASLIELSWQQGDRDTLVAKPRSQDLVQYKKAQTVQQQIESYNSQLSRLLDEVVGITITPINLERGNLRVKENSFGNFIADLMREHASADVAIVNSGSIRGEGVFKANSQIRRRDIVKALPYRDSVILIEVSGEQLLAALENGVSLIENMNGRFPQVSGLTMKFDSQANVGERVKSVQINGQPINPTHYYKLASSKYITGGGDGYEMLKAAEPLRYEQQMSELISDIVINELRYKGAISPKLDSRIIDIADNEMEQQ